MTEKRFLRGFQSIRDTKEDKEYNFHIDNAISLLNELNDENEQLKKDFDSVSHNWALMYNEAKNKVEELSKENQKLKCNSNIYQQNINAEIKARRLASLYRIPRINHLMYRKSKIIRAYHSPVQ